MQDSIEINQFVIWAKDGISGGSSYCDASRHKPDATGSHKSRFGKVKIQNRKGWPVDPRSLTFSCSVASALALVKQPKYPSPWAFSSLFFTLHQTHLS